MVNAGANAGSLTLTAALVPGVKVFAFEPHPMTYSVLAANVALNADRYAALLLPAASS
jgi:FkbM family methyltransferase